MHATHKRKGTQFLIKWGNKSKPILHLIQLLMESMDTYFCFVSVAVCVSRMFVYDAVTKQDCCSLLM